MLRRFLLGLALSLTAAPAIPAGTAPREPPRVVATIPPVHALAADVTAGISVPTLLIPGGRSPHDYAMRPSDARALADADAILWVGESVEPWMEKPLRALGHRATVIAFDRVPGITRHKQRTGGVWERGAFARGDSHAHGGEARAPGWDGHLWLSPPNAKSLADAVASALGKRDPENAARYRANAAVLKARIDSLDAALKARLGPVRAVPFVVFHDAYQYFERHYGLAAVGAIAIGPERAPSAKRLAAVRRAIRERGARCVFREPQFGPALAETIVAGTGARLAVLDPLGAALAPGPGQWFALMEGLARSLTECLGAGR